MEAMKKYCACNCGTEIIPQRHHKYHPQTYAIGHARVAETKKFLDANKDKHVCACGCGEFISIRAIHKSPTVGIPKFKPMHGGWAFDEHKIVGKGLHSRRLNRSKEYEFTFWQRVDLLIKCKFSCSSCGWNANYHALQFDHVIPLCAGGLPTLENGQTLCRKCHALKTNKETSEFRYNLWYNTPQGNEIKVEALEHVNITNESKDI